MAKAKGIQAHKIFKLGKARLPANRFALHGGRKQQMTWAWLDKYCDEAYAIFDEKNRFKKTVIDKAKITASSTRCKVAARRLMVRRGSP